MVFSPKGNLLASGDLDGIIRIWDIRTGKTAFKLKEDLGRIHSLAFSPDGQALITVSYQKGWRLIKSRPRWNTEPYQEYTVTATAMTRWDLKRRSQVWRKKILVDCNHMILSPNGKVIATDDPPSARIKLWNAETGELIGHLPGKIPFTAFAFSPDSKTLAVAYEGREVALWAVTDREVVARFRARWESDNDPRYENSLGPDVRALAFSPDGRYVVAGHNESHLTLYEIKKLVARAIKGCRCSEKNCLFFMPDSKRFVTLGTNYVQVLKVPSGEKEQGVILNVPDWPVSIMAFSADGKVFATDYEKNRTIALWRLDEKE